MGWHDVSLSLKELSEHDGHYPARSQSSHAYKIKSDIARCLWPDFKVWRYERFRFNACLLDREGATLTYMEVPAIHNAGKRLA
jgi:hypothetical protein